MVCNYFSADCLPACASMHTTEEQNPAKMSTVSNSLPYTQYIYLQQLKMPCTLWLDAKKVNEKIKIARNSTRH